MNGLTLASYNAHCCVGSDGRYDPDRVVAVLEELDADLIALQEIGSPGHPHDPIDALDRLHQLDVLARATGLSPIAGTTMFRNDAPFGNAMLTRLPVKDVRRIDLSRPGREPRGALDVDLEVRGSPLRVIATHFGLGARERRAQCRRLLEVVSSASTDVAVTVLLGDLNEWWSQSWVLRQLRAHLGDGEAPATYPARVPIIALDRIFVAPNARAERVVAHRSALAKSASDHLPVKVVVQI
jgi:endonuclease/exonuclease/phosphatase family metal-dependent hydrolase